MLFYFLYKWFVSIWVVLKEKFFQIFDVFLPACGYVWRNRGIQWYWMLIVSFVFASPGFTASPTPQQPQNSRGLNVDFDSVFGNNTNANNLDSTGKCCSPIHTDTLSSIALWEPADLLYSAATWGFGQWLQVHCIMSRLSTVKVLDFDLFVCG